MTANYDIIAYTMIMLSLTAGCLTSIWIITFYKLWKLELKPISVRHPKSVILFGILCCLPLYTRIPIQIYLSIDLKSGLFKKFVPFQTFISFLSFVGVVYVMVFRTWMAYYDIKCVESLQNEKWMKYIDKTIDNQHSWSWYITNRNKYGNPKYVIITLLIPWILLTSFGTISTIFFGRTNNNTTPICILIGCCIGIICLFILSFKLPKFNDIYRLRKETKIISTSTAICLCTFLIVFMSTSRTNPGEIGWILLNATLGLLVFLLAMVSFCRLFIEFNYPKMPCFIEKYKSELLVGQENQPQNKNEMKLVDVLQNYELFKIFAQHITKQMALENLLFLLETHQFVQCINRLISIENNEKYENGNNILNEIVFPSKLPKSTIVKDVNDINSVICASIQLFAKYISNSDAEFCINIPWDQRETLCEFFGENHIKQMPMQQYNKYEKMKNFMIKNKITLKDMYIIFDESRSEIYGLIQAMFLTFNVTDVCVV